MTEEIHGEEQALPEQQPTEYSEELERRFSEPILKGNEGIDKAQIWISAFLVVIAAVIAYSNTFSLPFRMEDRELIFGNAGIQRFVEFDKALAVSPRQPIGMLGLGLNEWLLPSAPASFRIVSIALHALGAVLVFLLCRRLFRGTVSESVAMLAGLLFALHPLATESINFLSVRGGLLATVFSLASIVLMLRATEEHARVRIGPYAGALLCFTLAWGSMPAVAGLPLLVLAADRVVHGSRMTLPRFGAHLGYWALLLVLLVAHMAAFAMPATAVEPAGLSFTTRLAALYQQYIWIVAPHNLSAFHPLPEANTATQALLAGVGVLLLLAASLLLLWKRSVAGFGLLWVVVAQLGWAFMGRPESGIAEYQAYFPLAGFALLLPWAFQLVPALGQLRTFAGIAAVVLLLAGGVGTFSRNQVWQSDTALWQDASLKYPPAVEPRLRLARALMQDAARTAGLAAQASEAEAERARAEAQDLFNVAEEELKSALDTTPEDADVLYAQGQLMEYTGRPQEAAEAYRKALRRAPGHPEALWHLAVLLQRQAQPEDTAALTQAVEMYRRADEAGHLPPNLLPLYGRALGTLGAVEESRNVFARAVALTQGPVQEQAQAALNELAKTLQSVNAVQQQSMAVIQGAPDSPDALRLRGQLLSSLGYNLEASYVLGAAIQRNPQDGNAWLFLGLTRARMNSAAAFVREWPVAPQSPLPNTTPWRLLAANTSSTGDWNSALVYLQAADRAGELAGLPLPVAAGDLAVQVGEPRQADAFYKQAAGAVPTDPLPWLRLTDLAISQKDLASARTYYVKARERNASPEDLAKRKEKIGDVPEAGAPAILR